jgi:hypothetical protein
MKTMKTPNQITKLIAVVAALLLLGASQAGAFVIDWFPVGIASGQTARVNILNTSESAIVIGGCKFVESDGSLLREFRDQSVPPGKTMSFDLNRDTLTRPQSRVQLHVLLEGEAAYLRHVIFSMEVFNNADGKTMAFVGGTDTLVPVPLVSVVSRKTHAGTPFDIDLPLTDSPGIECRSGGVAGDYTLIFTFTNPLTSVGGASVTSGTGSVSSSAIGADAHEYVVNLTGIANAQEITVTLTDVNDSLSNHSPSLQSTMGLLLGDTSASRIVNASDIGQTKAQSGQAVTASNFRTDVNANGSINASDVSLVKARSGTAIP